MKKVRWAFLRAEISLNESQLISCRKGVVFPRPGRILIASLLFLAVGLLQEGSAQTQKLKLAYVSSSGATATPWVTKEAGLFKKNDVEVEVVFIPGGGSTTIQALLAGDIDLAHVAGNAAMEANLSGADTVLIASVLNRPVGFYLMGQPGIKTVEELRGSHVAITRFGTAADFLTRIALKRFQLSPERDVTLVQLGGIPQVAAGLEAKAVKAGFVSSPLNLNLIDMGYVVLLDFGRTLIFPHTTVVARKSVMNQKDQAFRAAVRAMAEGIKVYRTQRDFTLKVLDKYMRTQDRKKLAQAYDTYAPHLEKVPYVDLKGVENVLMEIDPRHPGAKNRKPADFVDHRYIKALDESGFFRDLYREGS